VDIGRWWWLWFGYGYKFEGKCWALIILSSNARRVPFEYPYIYLNKKEKVCKARVNKWITNQI
jgi:hypothetical protein